MSDIFLDGVINLAFDAVTGRGSYIERSLT